MIYVIMIETSVIYTLYQVVVINIYLNFSTKILVGP